MIIATQGIVDERIKLHETWLYNEPGGKRFNLRKHRFDNIDFSDCELSGATFANSIFNNCNFSNCDLSDCNFSGTILYNTNFSESILERVAFKNSKHTNSDFSDTVLIDCNLRNIRIFPENTIIQVEYNL